MPRIASLMVLVLLASVAAGDVVSDVRCQEIRFSKAAENRDLEAFASLLDDDARFVGRTVMRGPEEIQAAWQVFFSAEGPKIKWRPQVVEVLADGKLALTRGPYRVVNKTPEGNLTESWGTFNSVWRFDPNRGWRVVFDAGSPAAEPPDDKSRALLDAGDDC